MLRQGHQRREGMADGQGIRITTQDKRSTIPRDDGVTESAKLGAVNIGPCLKGEELLWPDAKDVSTCALLSDVYGVRSTYGVGRTSKCRGPAYVRSLDRTPRGMGMDHMRHSAVQVLNAVWWWSAHHGRCSELLCSAINARIGV